MFERLEQVFREMNRAEHLDGMLRAALGGLEELLEGTRARIVPLSYELTHRLNQCSLEGRFILALEDESTILHETNELGQTVTDSRGLDPQRPHCCIVPFRGGLLYLDSSEPLPDQTPAVAGMVAQQLVANLGASTSGLVRSGRDPLKTLPGESWFNNQLHQYESFTVVALELNGFEKLKALKGWESADTLLRELVAFLSQRLGPDDLLARCTQGEFLVLTDAGEKSELVLRWTTILRDFEETGIARLNNLCLAAGLAICPEDGLTYAVRPLAQAACSRASRVGARLLAVAAPSFRRLASEEDPRDRFDARSTMAVEAAVRECQVRRCHVTPSTLLWGLLEQESELSQLLEACGLSRRGFRNHLEAGKESQLEFSEAAFSVFGCSLEMAHRNGRSSVRVEDLFLACLADRGAEAKLRECGLQYGRLLVGLYRTGLFATEQTFLVGEFGSVSPAAPRPALAFEKPQPPAFLLNKPFGENFTSEVWALLGRAREEAKRVRHDLDFEHLYIAVLLREGGPVEAARKTVAGLYPNTVFPERSTTRPHVLRFFHNLDRDFPEVTTTLLAASLRQVPQVRRLMRSIGDSG